MQIGSLELKLLLFTSKGRRFGIKFMNDSFENVSSV